MYCEKEKKSQYLKVSNTLTFTHANLVIHLINKQWKPY